MSRNETRAPGRKRRRAGLGFAAIVSALLLATGATAAASTPSIEGIWSFSGGQIAVQPAGSGTFEGIVVAPTTFAKCVHPVGQHIWTKMTEQSDGSYWGLHQWYENAACTEDPTYLGPTAWRVVEEPNGSRYLRVCLSQPGQSQPTIPVASSPGVGASYGCQNSSLTAPLASAGVGSFKEAVTLPSAKRCASGRKFNIHIRDTKYDPFKTVVVMLQGHKLKVAHHGSTYVATVSLVGLPPGAFTIKIKAITFRGHSLSGSRTYHTCAASAKKSKPKKLH